LLHPFSWQTGHENHRLAVGLRGAADLPLLEPEEGKQRMWKQNTSDLSNNL